MFSYWKVASHDKKNYTVVNPVDVNFAENFINGTELLCLLEIIENIYNVDSIGL